MKPLQDAFFVKIEERDTLRREDGTEILGHDGKPLKSVSKDFNYSENQNRVGTVVSIPHKLTQEYKSWGIINKGDSVLLHKEAFSPDFNENGLQRLQAVYIIAKVDGENLIPLGDRVFLNKIENTETKIGSIYLPFATEHIQQEGIVKWASAAAKDWGIAENDVAFMQEVAKADIYFNGERYYTVEKEMLLGKKANDTLEPYGYYVTILPEPEKESLIFIPVKHRENTLKGTTVGVGVKTLELKPSNRVVFFRLKQMVFGDLLILREEMIIGTIN